MKKKDSGYYVALSLVVNNPNITNEELKVRFKSLRRNSQIDVLREKAKEIIIKNSLSRNIHLGSKNESYYTSEEEMLSSPFYNKLELKGCELLIYNNICMLQNSKNKTVN